MQTDEILVANLCDRVIDGAITNNLFAALSRGSRSGIDRLRLLGVASANGGGGAGIIRAGLLRRRRFQSNLGT
jgi:hypothetical protein